MSELSGRDCAFKEKALASTNNRQKKVPVRSMQSFKYGLICNTYKCVVILSIVGDWPDMKSDNICGEK